MSQTMVTPPPPPPVVAYPPPSYVPPPEPAKGEPWGEEDPLLWSARRARFHAIWGSSAIALFVLLFGIGMYTLFTAAIYEGDIEGNGGLILLLLSPFVLAIVGAVATGALARNVGRMSRQPLAPSGARTARSILWFSVFLWIMLLVVFPLSLTVTTEGNNSGEDPFPIGIITVLPVYIGLCVAIYATGASYSAWAENNKVECLLIIGLGWAAFAMFLLLPAVVSSWNIGAENPDINWDSAVWWLRFGNIFPAIAPWLIVVGLYFVHNRSLALLEEGVMGDTLPPSYVAPGGNTSADACPSCGGNLSVHPRTLELFCAACGWGLQPEAEGPIVVDATPAPSHAEYGFMEQTPAPAPAPVVAAYAAAPPAAPTAALTSAPTAAPSAAPQEPLPSFCGDCGGKMSVLVKTQQVYCTSCGAGLPGSQPAPTPHVQQTQQPAVAPPPAQAPPPSPVPPLRPPPVPPAPPAQAVSAPVPAPAPLPSAPGNCPLCGARVAVHPRTGERFCPACGAGLGPER
jgi:predicted RNA-binding Zn-ribbon protein involved in translation (DUF1610 family)